MRVVMYVTMRERIEVFDDSRSCNTWTMWLMRVVDALFPPAIARLDRVLPSIVVRSPLDRADDSPSGNDLHW